MLDAHVYAESLREDGMGYVQGMADVAAFLLRRMPPPAAFGCLRHLCLLPFVRLLFR